MARNYVSSMSGGWLGGWIKWKSSRLCPQLGWVWTWAELCNSNKAWLYFHCDTQMQGIEDKVFLPNSVSALALA